MRMRYRPRASEEAICQSQTAGFILGIPEPHSQTELGKEKNTGEELGNDPWSQEKIPTSQRGEREMA